MLEDKIWGKSILAFTENETSKNNASKRALPVFGEGTELMQNDDLFSASSMSVLGKPEMFLNSVEDCSTAEEIAAL
ncbi:hypothetical protein [Pedobacter sp. Leaf194]|uniref:hypothetical protein n=1 Tax=Pedobacter sp. Leaf194 TaxID=1736297 RepID=UPI0007039101|nr:hypothetical protein [Pedobacter sp. Leaf194]KQS35719.1 hypothetical protein ASG14_09630 [Pedobacter sp. Leaf194]